MNEPKIYDQYILVDFENIQPDAESLSFLAVEGVKIVIFTNSTQKLTVDRVKVLQPLGERVEYFAMTGGGKNALDFFIAFYLGGLLKDNPEARAYIISSDTGFDPLLRHLSAQRKGGVRRLTNMAKIKKCLDGPVDQPAPPFPPGIARRRVTELCVDLMALPNERWPGTVPDLAEFIIKRFESEGIFELQVANLFSFMGKKELMMISPDKAIVFHLENIAAGAEGRFISKEPSNGQDPDLPRLAQIIRDDLSKRGNSKPRKLKTLTSTIRAVLKNEELSEPKLQALLDLLKSGQIITVSDQENISYNLKSEHPQPGLPGLN